MSGWDDAIEKPKKKKVKGGAHAVEIEEAQEEADATGQPVRVKGMGTADTPRLEPEDNLTQWMFVTDNHIAELMRDVKSLLAAVGEIRAALSQAVVEVEGTGKRETPKEQVQRTAKVADPKPAFPTLEATRKKNEAELHKSAQEVLANNKAKKPVVDIPSLDVLNHAALGYVKAHGKGALETRLAQYHVKRVSEIPEEKRHLFLQDIS